MSMFSPEVMGVQIAFKAQRFVPPTNKMFPGSASSERSKGPELRAAPRSEGVMLGLLLWHSSRITEQINIL